MWHYPQSSPHWKGGGVRTTRVSERLRSPTAPSPPPYLSPLSYLHQAPSDAVSSISHTPSSHRAFAPLFLWGTVFPVLLLVPLPQGGFHFLAISAKHHCLSKRFLKLLPSHKYRYRNVPFRKFIIYFADLCSSVWIFDQVLTKTH